jgi:hypothetical protein
MIPHHVLEDLGPNQRVAVLAYEGDLHFLVHSTAAVPADIKEYADRDGSEVMATHMGDPEAILALVAGLERDVGGEA